jgi:hypothetical protein
MGSLSNYQIEDIAKHYRIPLIDCCMKDELPQTIKDGYYIINLESSTQGNGTHWTALIIQPNIAVFFDSFGAPPSTEIIHFVKKRKGLHLAFNNEIIQDLESDNCGFFCIYLCWFIQHHKGGLVKRVDDFTRLFSEDTKQNDGILRQLFQCISDKNPPKPVLKLLKKKH